MITQRWLIKAVVASPSGILIMIMACVKKKRYTLELPHPWWSKD